jgi:hypothetical protein
MDKSSLLHDNVAGIWLEFDMINSNTYEPIPNIFIRLKPPEDVLPNGRAVVSIIEKSLPLLNQMNPPAQMSSNLCRCLELGIERVYISHFGAMLSRGLQTIRINIAGIQKNHIADYLNQLGLKAQAKNLGIILQESIAFFDRIVVCLDIGKDIGANVGLECFIDGPPNENERWLSAFDYLVKKGLCDRNIPQQILAWPGFMRPIPDNAKYWPDNLLIESILRPSNHFSCIYRKISHIKINCDVQKSIELKVYFGAVHVWVTSRENNQSV